MRAARDRRFPWLAFTLALVVLAAVIHRWLSLRYHGEKGFAINWYEEMVAPVFYAGAVLAPLLVAIAVGRLIARRQRAARIASVGLVMVAALGLTEIVPAFTRWDAEHGAMASRLCRQRLQMLGVALRMYADDHGGRLPAMSAWPATIEGLRRNPQWLRCPADARDGGTPDFRSSYALNPDLRGAALADIEDPASVVLLSDGRPGAGPLNEPVFRHPRRWGQIIPDEPGLNVAFAGGHVAWVSRSEW